MRRAAVAAWLLLALAGTARAEPGAVVLAKRFGGRGLDQGWGLAFDGKGNFILSGFGSDPVDLGGGLLAPKDADGVFAASYTPSGGHRWSWRQSLGSSYYAGPLGVDATGAALLVGDHGPSLFLRRVRDGKLDGELELDHASGLGVAALGQDIVFVGFARPISEGSSFVAARAPDGTLRWRHELEGTAIAVAPAGDGALIVAGQREHDIFVEKRGVDGLVAWTRRLGLPGYDESRVQIAVAANGDVVAAYGSRPATVARLSPAGEVLWSRGLDGLNAGGVAVGPRGEVAVAGDAEVTKLDAAGTPVWKRSFTATEVYPRGVAIDRDGRVCATGWFAGKLVVGAKKLAAIPDGYDVMLVCMAP